MSSPQSRRFLFTWNNYPHDYLAYFNSHIWPITEYGVVGQEIAPTTGTRHLQGYLFLKKRSRVSTLSKLLQNSHVEIARGDHEQNLAYCSKDGNFITHGEIPLTCDEAGKDYWIKMKQAILTEEIEEPEHAKFFIQNHSTIRAIQRENPTVLENLDHTEKVGIWIYGPTGCGKSRHVRETHPVLYSKNLNKWWDGYRGEEIVLLEDIDPACNKDNWLDRYLKIWMDIYPFTAEIKQSSKVIRPKKFYVTSQYPPEQVFKDPETLEALNRRMTVVCMGPPHKKHCSGTAECFVSGQE